MCYFFITFSFPIGNITKEVHGEELCNKLYKNGALILDEELWQYAVSFGEIEFIGIKEDREYIIENKDLFKRVDQPVDDTLEPPSREERITTLGEQLTQEKLKNIRKDSTIAH